jgi:hypothetical protein
VGALTTWPLFSKYRFKYWLVVWNILFFHILGISSFQLTFTPSFSQRGR